MLNWGIMGAGNIADAVLPCMKMMERSKVLAVASQTPGKGERFARRWGIERHYTSYADLIMDDDINVVYVATTHPQHLDNVLRAIEAGKHVFCEKPLGTSPGEVSTMLQAAQEKKVYLAEAIWSCYFPAYQHMRTLIADGAIGQVVGARAGFSLERVPSPSERLFQPHPLGGASAGMSTYPAAFFLNTLGKDIEDLTTTHIYHDCTDTRFALTAKYPVGRLGLSFCGLDFYSPWEGCIYGTEGYIILPRFLCPSQLTIMHKATLRTESFPYTSLGYQFEFRSVEADILAGRLTSDIVSPSDSMFCAEFSERITRDLIAER